MKPRCARRVHSSWLGLAYPDPRPKPSPSPSPKQVRATRTLELRALRNEATVKALNVMVVTIAPTLVSLTTFTALSASGTPRLSHPLQPPPRPPPPPPPPPPPRPPPRPRARGRGGGKGKRK